MTAALTTTLRPGLLVSLSTSITGNVDYFKTVLPADIEAGEGAEATAWRTDKLVKNAAEMDEASDVRSKARGKIASVCYSTGFGYLCPTVDREKLYKAIDEARALVDDFNRRATVTNLSFYALTGEIIPNDVMAIRAINAEVRTLLDEVTEGVAKCEVDVIRKAATRSLQLGSMLSPDAQARLEVGIKAARKAATEIKKAGEQAAQEVDRGALQRLAEARTAFLDLDGGTALQTPGATTTARAIDLAPHAEQAVAKADGPATRAPLEIN